MRPSSDREARDRPKGDREPLLVSACLVGLRTRLDGRARPFPKVAALSAHYRLVPVCPEQLGGSPTPREAAEIEGGGGLDVLRGAARVMTRSGMDVTAVHVRGAEETLAVARLVGATKAVLKARSPSCGVGQTYDGTFSHRLISESGVAAALLAREGLFVMTEEDFQEVLRMDATLFNQASFGNGGF